MNYALDSCCVFDPVARVGLFLHLHLASLLPGLELCPSPKLPMLLPYTLLQCRHHVYRLRRHFWAPNVWTAANIRAALIHGWKKWEPRKPVWESSVMLPTSFHQTFAYFVQNLRRLAKNLAIKSFWLRQAGHIVDVVLSSSNA